VKCVLYLGTHKPYWLWDKELSGVPLMVSHRTLGAVVHKYPAVMPWTLDSGGFTELTQYGEWRLAEADYIQSVRQYQAQIGKLLWCAPQDWMCEPVILQKTGLVIAEHQLRTVRSYLSLRSAGLPVIPVLQGWTLEDYLQCWGLYEEHGVGLATESTVGLGTICRRQGTAEAEVIVRRLQQEGLRLHGFGFKLTGLAKVSNAMKSADSLAWSMHARYRAALPGCTHRNCANCKKYALAWRQRVLKECGCV